MRETKEYSSRAEEFIQMFTSLERDIRAEYDLPIEVTTPIRWLGRECEEFAKYKKDINQIVDIRNMLQHSPKYGNEYVVEPSQEILDSLRMITDLVLRPPRAKDVMTKVADLCWCSMKDCVRPAMEQMLERGFSFIPILDDGVVIGVFSESSLLMYLLSDDPVTISNTSTRFADIEEFLMLDNRPNERFIFAGINVKAIELERAFDKARSAGKKIGMAFITRSGNAKEKLIGVVVKADTE